jgi:MerR family transcriptional regulator, light-induced transcriptional regulator
MASFNPNFMGAKFCLEIDGDRPGSVQLIRRRETLQNAAFEIEDEWDCSSGRLEHAIETEILPRLLVAHMKSPPPRGLSPESFEADEVELDVETFVDLIRWKDVSESMCCVEALVAKGASLEMIYLGLLASTARQLGKLWDDDLCCFTDVAVGLTRLHQVLSGLSQRFMRVVDCQKRVRRAIIAPLPLEQHTFGLVMVADCFRRAGWEVVDRRLAAVDRIEDIVRCEPFHLIGLSVSDERQLDRAGSTIRAIRQASCNRTILVMVGGHVFNDHPEIVGQIGADGTAANGFQAVERAENLLALMASQ